MLEGLKENQTVETPGLYSIKLNRLGIVKNNSSYKENNKSQFQSFTLSDNKKANFSDKKGERDKIYPKFIKSELKRKFLSIKQIPELCKTKER